MVDVITKVTGSPLQLIAFDGPLIVNPHDPPKITVLIAVTRSAGEVGGVVIGVVASGGSPSAPRRCGFRAATNVAGSAASAAH